MVFLFYQLLYFIGIISVFPLAKKIPIWFLTVTGFMWGMLLWVSLTVISLFLGLEYTWGNMVLLLLPVVLIAIWANIYNKTFNLSFKQWAFILGSFGVFSIIAFIVTNKNYVYATYDSFPIIYIGRVLARAGLSPWSVDQFVTRGLFIPIIQMTNHILPGEFVSGYQTLMGVTLLSVFAMSIFNFARSQFSLMLALFQTIFMVLVFTSSVVIRHIFYIHTNLQVGLFLFVALYSYWCYLRNETFAWLILGTVAIIGLAFTRVEGVMYALLILSLVMSLKRHKIKQRLLLVLPYSILAIIFHLYIYLFGQTFGLLNQIQLLVIIFALFGFMVIGVVGPKIPKLWVRLQKLWIGVVVGCLTLSFMIKPSHMSISLAHVVQNLVDYDTWGWSWISILIFLPYIVELKIKNLEERLLFYSIGGFIIVVLLLSFARNPYRLGSTDTGNRLLLAIQPVIFFYIATKTEKLKGWFTALKKSH